MKNNVRKCPGENTPASGERRLERRRERKTRSEANRDERKELNGKERVKREWRNIYGLRNNERNGAV